MRRRQTTGSKHLLILVPVIAGLFLVSCTAAERERQPAAQPAVPEPAPDAAAQAAAEEPGADESPESDAPARQPERIVFTKADGADPTLPQNQDRITESVWITRGNDGGQIFNIDRNSRYIKSRSPVGTLWALGTTADLSSLEFRPFRIAVQSPKDVVGKDLVMFIEAEEIYLDVRFLSWSSGKEGGFSYERTTPGE